MGTIEELRRNHNACRRAERSAAFSRVERERFGRLADELARTIAAQEEDRLRRAATGAQLARIVVRARARRGRALAAAE